MLSSSPGGGWRRGTVGYCRYKWAVGSHACAAFGCDYIMNMDSDLLLVESYFAAMLADYATAVKQCESGTPVISGYTSQKWGRAYGANYFFSKSAYFGWVEEGIADVSTPCFETSSSCMCGYSDPDSRHYDLTGPDCRPKPWDDELMKSHIQQCKGDGDRLNCDTDIPGRCHGTRTSYIYHPSIHLPTLHSPLSAPHNTAQQTTAQRRHQSAHRSTL